MILNALLYGSLLLLNFLVIVLVAAVPCLLLKSILYGLWRLDSGKVSRSRKNKMKDNLFMLSAYGIFRSVLSGNKRRW